MRYLLGSVFVYVLGVALLAGCSESGSAAEVYCVDHVCPCTETGIRATIEAGGEDPYTFDCDGPHTVVTRAATIEIDNDVILDGEGNLTVVRRGDDLGYRLSSPMHPV